MPPKNPKPADPEILKRIDLNLNPDVDLSRLFATSAIKLWWKCSKHDHSYFSSVRHVTDGQGCSVCSGKQILDGFNDLATLRPDIAYQWHPTKNENLLPTMVSRTYSKKVWWQCDLGHEFQAFAVNRKNSRHCPVCSGLIILKGFNDVASQFPHLVEAFILERNSSVKLDEIGKSYSKKLWWKALCGHEIESLISNCIPKIPCAYCAGKKVMVGFNDIATTNPEIINQWHPVKNLPITPQSITRGSKDKIWWICENGHEDLILPSNKVAIGNRCSFCDGTKLMAGLNDLATVYPHLIQEWHSTLNGKIQPKDVSANTDKKYWWQCSKCSQSWDACPANRGRKGTGCPYCTGRKMKTGVNDLLTVNPEVGAEWHPTKNGSLTAQDITVGAVGIFWWKCGNGHEWSARVNDRVGQGSGCIKCYRNGLVTGTKSFVENYSHLLKEWDYSKNQRRPEDTSEFSSRKVWWICQKNPLHEWEAAVATRTSRNSGCPACWQSSSSSAAEIELGDFLENIGVKIERNNKKILDKRAEIDIYIPEQNIGIEYNGLYWHSESAGKDRKYHKNKYEMCQIKGISLIQVWEDNWRDNKELVMRQLAYRFHKLRELQKAYPLIADEWFEKHHARKLSSVTIDNKIATTFLEESHIQGGIRGSFYYALKTSDDKIVAVLVMARSGKDGEMILSRYATKGIVMGGFTKLLKYAITECKPKKIVTFSDHSNFDGNLYGISGFTKEAILAEDYMYVKNKKRYHKFGFRLTKFKNNPNLLFSEGMTERELAILNGYTRIWDSGKTRWVLEI